MSSDSPLPPNLGVRERKKRVVMEHIQSAALDLFDAHGFGRVTIEQVADAAGVSPSTVYRNFGTKQRLVTYDEIDRLLVETLLDSDPLSSPIAAARRVLDRVRPVLLAEKDSLARRIRYVMEEPSVYAALSTELRDSSDYLARQLLERAGGVIDPLDADVAAHTLCDTVLVAARIWHESGYQADYGTIAERCFDILERGLRLGPPA